VQSNDLPWHLYPATPAGRPRRSYEPWSPEEDARLEAGVHLGWSVVDLAELHGRSEGAIYSRIDMAGLPEPQRHRQWAVEPCVLVD